MNIDFIQQVGFFKWIRRTFIRQYYKRILRCDHEIYLPTGKRLLLPVSSGFASEAFVTNGNVDWGSEALLFQLLRNKGYFLDIGANIGYYSLYMLPKVIGAYCFEPDPRNIEFLKHNIGQVVNVFLVQKAVGNKTGKTNFVLEAHKEVSHIAQNGKLGENVIEVEITTVDAFVQENAVKVEAIKIDVEGFDVQVLQGAISTLQTQRPIVLTEAQPNETLFKIAQEINYSVFAFVCHKSWKKEFLKIEFREPQYFHTKMLFLIPQERVSETIYKAKTLNTH